MVDYLYHKHRLEYLSENPTMGGEQYRLLTIAEIKALNYFGWNCPVIEFINLLYKP
jgi:hypothetical protein